MQPRFGIRKAARGAVDHLPYQSHDYKAHLPALDFFLHDSTHCKHPSRKPCLAICLGTEACHIYLPNDKPHDSGRSPLCERHGRAWVGSYLLAPAEAPSAKHLRGSGRLGNRAAFFLKDLYGCLHLIALAPLYSLQQPLTGGWIPHQHEQGALVAAR